MNVDEPAGDRTIATVRGYVAVFGQWAEIESPVEGHFLERVAEGSFRDTIERDRARYRALFEHGRDPVIARRPLGPLRGLREDSRGVAYELGLLDTPANRELLPGLRAGLYGSSFRGKVELEAFDGYPARSTYNPGQLPERTIQRVALLDVSVTAFPAYLGAVASARSAEPGVWTPARRRERLIEVM
jgi:HK97 family phage prohead protease